MQTDASLTSSYHEHQALKYLAHEEQAAIYPRLPQVHATHAYKNKEPSKQKLIKLFEEHKERFDNEYK